MGRKRQDADQPGSFFAGFTVASKIMYETSNFVQGGQKHVSIFHLWGEEGNDALNSAKTRQRNALASLISADYSSIRRIFMRILRLPARVSIFMI